MHFNLYDIHDPVIDRDPKSWVCIKGKDLQNKILQLIELTQFSKKQLAKELSKNLNYAITPTEKIIYGKKEWIPITVVTAFINLLQKLNKVSKWQADKIRLEFIESAEYFRVNTLRAVSVKLPHALTLSLCKLIGAHAADGNLTIRIEVRSKNKHSLEKFIIKNFNKKIKIRFNNHLKIYSIWFTDYNFKNKIKNLPNDISFSFLYHFSLEDEYKEAVEKFASWIKECFGIEVEVKKHFKDNAYIVRFQNKVIGRFFTEILKIQGGNKIRIIDEPQIVKNSPFKFRKAFASGVLTFDGCVELDGTISLNTFSHKLLNSVLDIIKSDPKICNSLTNKIYVKRGRLRTPRTLNSDEYYFLSNFFEKDTEKYYKVLEFANGYFCKVNSLSNAVKVLDTVYPLKWYKVNLSQIIKIFQLENFEGFFIIEELIDQIKEKNDLKKLGRDIVIYRLKLLEQMNIVKVAKYRDITGEKVTGMKKAYLFNPKINSWRIPFRPWLEDFVKLS